VTERDDEFSFLAEQAEESGLTAPIPPGRRVTLDLPDGRTISGLVWGDAPPVVTLLHGGGLNAHTWDTTVLAAGLPALAIDLPGHGDSSWRDDADYSARTSAPDVAAAIEAWTTQPQVLVGQSLGGLVGAAVAASRPDLVRELVVIDITPGVDPNAGPTQVRDFLAGPADYASRDELVDRAIAFGLGGSRRATERGVILNTRIRPDGRVEWKHHLARLASLASASPELAATMAAQQDAFASVLTTTGWDDLAAVAAPVTLIRGAQGYVTDADAAEFADRMPDAAVRIVPSGHNVQEQIPAELAAILGEIAG
jgi:pimeloyl-ACP methyl ester carboxylesterase